MILPIEPLAERRRTTNIQSVPRIHLLILGVNYFVLQQCFILTHTPNIAASKRGFVLSRLHTLVQLDLTESEHRGSYASLNNKQKLVDAEDFGTTASLSMAISTVFSNLLSQLRP